MIRDTQAIPKGPVKLKPSLKTILEGPSSQKENAQTESRGVTKQSMYASKGTIPLEADENLVSKLWREVRKMIEEDRSERASPTFPFMEKNHPLEGQVGN